MMYNEDEAESLRLSLRAAEAKLAEMHAAVKDADDRVRYLMEQIEKEANAARDKSAAEANRLAEQMAALKASPLASSHRLDPQLLARRRLEVFFSRDVLFF
jgi:septal ring factor EnvC (AmiA/AmiB activator)